MNNNDTKMICTTMVWAATALIFVFGVFRFNYTGVTPGVLWALVALAVVYGATAATRAIWKFPPNEPPKS